MRAKAQAEGRPPRYDGTWRDRDSSDAPAGVAPAIRFRAPQEGQTLVQDHVQGDVTFPNTDLDDLIILRSDGNPTYNLSVVVDDHDMGITHVVRGVDHLTNAARQSQIFAALGWDIPEMAHIPLIHGPDGAKLSKRHGALGVESYREMGYLPDAMRNYLARLGWSHGDDEIFSTEQMIEWFDLDGIGKSAARFDTAKLENLNGHYIRHMEDAALSALLLSELPYLPEGADAQTRMTPAKADQIGKAMAGLKERAKTLNELLDGAQFILAKRPLAFEDKAAALITDETRPILRAASEALAPLPDWTMDAIEEAVRSVATTLDLKLGKVAQPLRAALTGRSTSPGIFDVVFVLGREETLARLADIID
jgi:glutamyl-tRNA synthetase